MVTNFFLGVVLVVFCDFSFFLFLSVRKVLRFFF